MFFAIQWKRRQYREGCQVEEEVMSFCWLYCWWCWWWWRLVNIGGVDWCELRCCDLYQIIIENQRGERWSYGRLIFPRIKRNDRKQWKISQPVVDIWQVHVIWALRDNIKNVILIVDISVCNYFWLPTISHRTMRLLINNQRIQNPAACFTNYNKEYFLGRRCNLNI